MEVGNNHNRLIIVRILFESDRNCEKKLYLPLQIMLLCLKHVIFSPIGDYSVNQIYVQVSLVIRVLIRSFILRYREKENRELQ
jgi:hypothetical protein